MKIIMILIIIIHIINNNKIIKMIFQTKLEMKLNDLKNDDSNFSKGKNEKELFEKKN